MRSLNIINLKNICKSHDQPILTNVNLKVNKGEFVVITGPSGSGKSTLLQILGLLEPATSGSYELNGQIVDDYSPVEIAQARQQYLGFIFQRYHLINHMTILENVMLPMQYGSAPKDTSFAMSLLERFAIHSYADKYPSQLSYGQQQRAAIARAIITKPKVVLADEPTGSLDDENATIVMKKLRQLHKEGQTVILITHNLELIKPSDIHYTIENKQLVRL